MTNEFLEVVLHNPVEPHQLAVNVVYHLDLSGWPHEIERGPAGEHLHIALMRRELRDDVIDQATFAPRSPGWLDCEAYGDDVLEGHEITIRSPHCVLVPGSTHSSIVPHLPTFLVNSSTYGDCGVQTGDTKPRLFRCSVTPFLRHSYATLKAWLRQATIAKRLKGWRAQIAILGARESKTFSTKAEAVSWAAQRETEIWQGKAAGIALAAPATVVMTAEVRSAPAWRVAQP